MHTTGQRIVALASLVALVAGCGALGGDVGEGDETRRATVVPKLHVAETDALPKRLQLDRLGLVISEIQLTPVGENEGVSYATSEPFSASFDLAEGETVERGEPVKLPESGKFDVTLRLEPASDVSDEVEGEPYSLQMAGYVAGKGDEEPGTDGTEDGDPIPAPFMPGDTDDSDDEAVDDAESTPTHWTPFRYRSHNSVVYKLDAVDIRPGEQSLAFRFDAREWSREVLDPLTDAVYRKIEPFREDDGEGGTRDKPVDVSEEIDQRGDGPRAAADHMSVQAVRGGVDY